MAGFPRGLVLVTGPTGSGKSTTLAAMLDQVNRTRSGHILTIEDPVEYLHPHKRCMVNQREIGRDAPDFAQALRSALREDPDVILVGEMRDLETISAAVTAAETGHLVFSTLHTTGAAATIDRIVDVFPPYQQQQIRTQLASVLRAVVSQQLLPRVGGSRARRGVRGAARQRRGGQHHPREQGSPDRLGPPDGRQAGDVLDGRLPRAALPGAAGEPGGRARPLHRPGAFPAARRAFRWLKPTRFYRLYFIKGGTRDVSKVSHQNPQKRLYPH